MPLSAYKLISYNIHFYSFAFVLQNEWLCLNCQTQRALSGQLGDLSPPPSPSKIPAKSQPTPPSSPARAVSTTPSPPAPTVTASATKAVIQTPSVTQAPADKSEHDSVTADAKRVVESAAVKQDKEPAVVDHTQVVPEPNEEQTLDTTCENTTVNLTPNEQTIRAAVLPADFIQADTKETDAKLYRRVEKSDPKAQSKMGGENVPEQHELVENESPSNYANVAENHESTDNYPSETTVLDNKPEIRQDLLQVTKAKLKEINEAKNSITSTVNSENIQACDNCPEVASLSKNPTKECSPELESLSNMQTSAETVPNNNNYSAEYLVSSPIIVTEKETLVNIGNISTNTLESSFIPEEIKYRFQVVSDKDKVKNKVVANSGSDAKHPFAHTSEHPDSTKVEFLENEYAVETKTGNMSPSENSLPHLLQTEFENDKIKGIYFDQAEVKQSGEEFEQESIEQGKAHKSTHESQANPADMPECANPTFPTPNELIISKLKTRHDILDEKSHNACVKAVDISSCTFSVLASSDQNTFKNTEGANVGTTESASEAEALPQSQVVEYSSSKAAVEFMFGKENEETLKNKVEHVRIEKTKHQYQASPSERELEDFSVSDNISIIDKTKKENVLTDEAVEDKSYGYAHKCQIAENCLASQMTALIRSVEASKQTASGTESIDNIRHSEKLEHCDIRSKMPSSSFTEAEKVQNFSKEETMKFNTVSVKTENMCVVKNNDSLSALRDQQFPENEENVVPEDTKMKQTSDIASSNAPEDSAIQVVLSGQRTKDYFFPAIDVKEDIQLQNFIKSNVQESVPITQKVDSFSSKPDKENEIPNTKSISENVLCTLNPVVDPSSPCPVASKLDKDKLSEEVQSPSTEVKNQDGTKPLIKPNNTETLAQVTVYGARTGSVLDIRYLLDFFC